MLYSLINVNPRKIPKVQSPARMRRNSRRKFIAHRRKWFNKRKALESFQVTTAASPRTSVHFLKKQRAVFLRSALRLKFRSQNLYLMRPGFYISKPFAANSFTWRASTQSKVHSNNLVQYNFKQTNLQNFLPNILANPLASVWAKIQSSNLEEWLWSNEGLLRQIQLNHSVVHTSTQLINKSFFFRNNLTNHIHREDTMLSSPYQVQLSTKARKLGKNLLIIQFLKSFRNTTSVKRLAIKARSVRTFISTVPSQIFFKSGIIRISSTLGQLDNNLNASKVYQTRTCVRGWLKLLRFFSSPTPRTFRCKPRRQIQRGRFALLRARALVTPSSPAYTTDSVHSSDHRLRSLQFMSRDSRFVETVSTTSLLTKFLFLDNSLASISASPKSQLNNSRIISIDIDKAAFGSRQSILSRTNLVPAPVFKYTLKRKLLRILSFHKFSLNVTLWYYNTLIRFIESCSGKKVFIKFNPFIENALAFEDLARCNLWHSRITAFQRLLGPKIFLKESLKILHIAIKFKDPTFFANWIKGMLYRMSFWKYRLLFRYIKYAMRYLFWLHFPRLGFKGLKLRLKGKISVAGNARTRTLLYKIGETGYSKFNNKVICDYSIVNTFTGVLGFKVWFFF